MNISNSNKFCFCLLDDLKIRELLELICDYLDITSIITFYCAIDMVLPDKYIKTVEQLTTTINEMEKKLTMYRNQSRICPPPRECPPYKSFNKITNFMC